MWIVAIVIGTGNTLVLLPLTFIITHTQTPHTSM